MAPHGTSSNKGAKNTTDPSAKNPTFEAAGPVAADSLAAESTRAGGSFGENRGSQPQAVKGSNSTFANEDTSSATTLKAAPDASRREDEPTEKETSSISQGSASTTGAEKTGEESSTSQGSASTTGVEKTGEESSTSKGSASTKGAEKTGEEPKSSSKHDADEPSGAPTSMKNELGKKDDPKTYAAVAGGAPDDADTTSSGATPTPTADNITSTTDDNTASSADPAPTYVHSGISRSDGKPHGKNLTEGGFDSDPKNNTSFNMDAIGTKDDPGRAGLQNLKQADNEEPAATAGAVRGNERFGALEDASA